MDVVVPKAGLTIETVEVLVWLKAAGDAVTAGEPLVELAADKADIVVDAPADGTLAVILAEGGETVVPGQVIATLAVEGEQTVVREAPVPPAADVVAGVSSLSDGPTRMPISRAALRAADELQVDVRGLAGSGPGGRVIEADVRSAAAARSDNGRQRSSPAARRLAGELGVDLIEVAGSGPGGRIVERDVRAAQISGTALPTVDPSLTSGPTARPRAEADESGWQPARWSAARRATARAMAVSGAHVVPVTLHRRAQVGAALAEVAELKAEGVRVTFNHAVLAAVAALLPLYRGLNAVWDGDHVLESEHVHLGVAVDDGGDLLLAVVERAEQLALRGVATATQDAVRRARAREPRSGPSATFTVSNLGMLGVEGFTPVVNHPQVAVLGVGAVVPEPVAIGDAVAMRPICHLSLTFDHRAVDGAPAARLLAAVSGRLAGQDR